MDTFDVACLVALIWTVLFVYQYTTYQPWWRDPIGRTIAAKDLAIVLLLFPITLATFFPWIGRNYQEFFYWLYVGDLFAVGAIMAWRMSVWYREMRRSKPGWQDPTYLFVKRVILFRRTRRH